MRIGIGIGIGFPRGGGSAPAATPLTVLGSVAKLWLRGDMGITLSAGGGVSAWFDQSGYANDFFQPLDSPQAAYEATGYAGKPSILFDGVDDNLVNTTLGATLPGGLDTPFSLYMPVQYVTAPANATVFGAGHHSDTSPYLFVYYNTTGPVFSVNKRDNANTLKSVSGGAASLNRTLLEVHHDGAANCVIAANGVESGPLDLNVGNGTLSRLSLGALVRTATTSLANARIAEVVLAGAVSSAGERAAMRTYFAARYP